MVKLFKTPNQFYSKHRIVLIQNTETKLFKTPKMVAYSPYLYII